MTMYRRIVDYVEAVGYACVEEVDNPGKPLFIHDHPAWLDEALAKPKEEVGAIWVESSRGTRIDSNGSRPVTHYTMWMQTTKDTKVVVYPRSYIIRNTEGELSFMSQDEFNRSYALVDTDGPEEHPEVIVTHVEVEGEVTQADIDRVVELVKEKSNGE